MKKLFLLAGVALSGLAAEPVLAQYYLVPNLQAHQNPGGLNTDSEGRFDLGLPGWTQVLAGDTVTRANPAWSPVQTLPFAFQMNGQSFTSYKVSTSGVLTFTTSATTVPTTRNYVLPAAQIPDNSVCIWGTLLTADNDYLITKTFGTAPNRQQWIQFNSSSLPAGGTNSPLSGAYVYCSIVLEETTNKVYLVWQRSGSQGQTLTAGIQLSATQYMQIAGSPNVSVPNLADTSPVDNGYYEFTPGTQPLLDVAGRHLSLPHTATLQSNVTIQGVFQNQGTQNINSLVVNYKVANGPVVSAPLSGFNVALLDTGVFVHPTPWRPTTGGVIAVKAWLTNPNGGVDQQPSNDTIRTTIVVGDSTMRRKVVEEDFTSSTCVPCRAGNANTRAVNHTVASNRGKYVEIKYQQNFPAPGNDPYYTLESGSRFGYYNGSYIPYMLLDGGWNENSQVYSTAILNQFQAVPALVRVSGDYSLTGTNLVTVQAKVRPLLPFPAGRLVAHVVVTERQTQNNIRTNGETRFYDVMKKMLPDQNGTALPMLVSGQDYTISQRFDITSLPTAQAVEHFDSLRVVVFVQDIVTKDIYQGEYMALRAVLGTRNSQMGPAFSLAPNPSAGRTTMLLTLTRSETVQVDVLDGLGRSVLSRPQVTLGIGEQEVPLDLTRHAAGLYTVRLTTSQGVRTSKLILE
jgi:hypothetical protein